MLQASAARFNRRSTLKNPNNHLFLFRLVFAIEDSRRNGGILMKSLAKKMHRFLVSEDGPTAVEYAVMLALIVIVCLAAISSIGSQASSTFQDVAASLAA